MAERKKVKKVSLSKQGGGKTLPKKAKKTSTKPPVQKNKKPSSVGMVKKKSLEVQNIAMNNSESKDVIATNKTENKKSTVNNNALRQVQTNNSRGRQRKNFGINWSIILGKKRAIRRKRISATLITFPLILFLVLFIFLTPTGPIEAITNSIAKFGGGKFPKQIVGGNTISLKSQNNTAFLLTDTHISGYTALGKELYEYQHDFSAPVLETSVARTLIFNRNSTGLVVLNNSGTVYEKELDRSILCADIADNGNIAVATESEKYSAQVDVYSKSMKHKFSWYLVDGLVSDVTLSKNGKYVAIAVLKAKGGSYYSEIYCFNIKSENPIFKLSVEGTPVLALENISSKYFSYITNKAVSYVSWKKGEQKVFEESGLSPSFYKTFKNASLTVFGKNTSSTVKIIANDGTEKARLTYNGLIDDITLSGDYVYILKGNKVFVLDFKGNTVNTLTNEQSPHYITASKNGIFVAENINLTYFGG